jgi:hypothetical protein
MNQPRPDWTPRPQTVRANDSNFVTPYIFGWLKRFLQRGRDEAKQRSFSISGAGNLGRQPCEAGETLDFELSPIRSVVCCRLGYCAVAVAGALQHGRVSTR